MLFGDEICVVRALASGTRELASAARAATYPPRHLSCSHLRPCPGCDLNL